MAERPAGPAVIESATVTRDREGVPRSGLVVGSLATGERFLADADAGDLDWLADDAVEPIGQTGRVDTLDGRSRFVCDRA